MEDKLDRYFSGGMPEGEKSAFFRELQENPEAQSEFVRMKNTEALAGLLEQTGDRDKTWNGLLDLNKRLNRRTARRFRISLLKYAAVACILLTGCWFLSREYTLHHQEMLFTEVEAPKGQRVRMVLADGSVVWLSPRTKIRIPNQFERTQRTVELDGEGYFEVARDKKRPFTVKTDRFSVKVLGTKFNVFSYKEKFGFETCLLEGSVLVYNNRNEADKMYLKPNEKVSAVDGKLIKSASDFNNVTYLQSGIYSFQGKPFVEILDLLSLWYGVRFKITGTLALTRRISGKFRQSEEVENILTALQGVHHFNFRKITDDQFEIF